jgi:hypothetical protein
VLQSQFAQFDVIPEDKFIKFIKRCGIDLNAKELEYYDKKDVIRPIFRLNIPTARRQNYESLPSSFVIREYYKHGLIELPEEGDFVPRNEYKSANGVKTLLYYHKYQFVSLRHLTMGNRAILYPYDIEEIQNFQGLLEKIRERNNNLIDSSRSSKHIWDRKIGLLILLQELYGFDVGPLHVDPSDRKDFFKKWKSWKMHKYQPMRIKEQSNMTIEQLEAWHKDLCKLGYNIDPLSSWFPLLQLIDESQKQKLKEHAFLAQQYYKLARMVSLFLYDLTKKRMSDPDDSIHESNIELKREVYGKRFSYYNNTIKRKILDHYLIDRDFRIALIYEGETEDLVIRSIFNVLGVDSERDGIFLYCARGQGNMKSKSLRGLIEMARKYSAEPFLLLDWDGIYQNLMRSYKKGRMNKDWYIKQKMRHIWEKDFEYDNFGIDRVLGIVNPLLRKNTYLEIRKSDVEKELQYPQMVLMKAIDKIIRRNNPNTKNNKLDSLISKRQIAKILITPRIKEIRYEQDSGEWIPSLPIEKVLSRIFYMIPKIYG